MSVLDLAKLKNGELINGGLVFLHSYSKKSYQDGKKHYISGLLKNKSESIQMKIWDAHLVKVFSDNEMGGKVYKISGEVKTYRDQLEITVNSVSHYAGIPASNFLATVDTELVFNTFIELVNTLLSQRGVSMLVALFDAEGLYDRFKQEFAGTKMHDAQIGGLMHHTVKMLKLAETLVKNDSRLEEYSDLIYLGVILHDIGKLQEYELGVRTQHSFVTHRVFGVELLAKYKKDIVDIYDETFYYHLLAIIQGHHGIYGEPPKTVWALIVHYLDMMDSLTTGILDKITSGNDVREENGLKSVYHDSGYLVI